MKNSGRLILTLLLISFCGLSSLVFALTDEEMVRQLDEKFLKGEIPVDVYRELKKKYTGGGSTPQAQAAPNRPVKEPKGNLLKNFSMEEDSDGDNMPDGWRKWGAGCDNLVIIGLDSEVKYSGDKSVRFNFQQSASNDGRISQVVKVEPGKSYLLSCRLKGENLRGSDGFLMSAYYFPTKPGPDDKGIQAANKTFYGEKGTFDWKAMAMKIKPLPANAQYLRVIVRFHMGTPGTKAWIDDVVLMPVD